MCSVMSMICWCHHLTTFEVAKLLIKAFIAFFRIRLLVSNLPANPACFPALIRLLCWFLMISVLSWRPLTPPQSRKFNVLLFQLHAVPGLWLPPAHNCYNFSCYNFTYPASNCSLDGGWANALTWSPHCFFSVSCLFSNICWDVRWSQENSIEHNKELAAALRWTGDSNMAVSFIGCGPQPRKTMFSLLTPGCNTLESDIKQFALLCEQNVEALWRSVWKFVYQVIMFGYFWPCRLVNCHAVDRSKAWAVVQGRGEASGNHHYQLSWFKQNCVQDTLSPHSASVDSLSGFASSCWIGSLRKLDCPSNP